MHCGLDGRGQVALLGLLRRWHLPFVSVRAAMERLRENSILHLPQLNGLSACEAKAIVHSWISPASDLHGAC